jgi:hypothetical protein
MGKLEPGYRDKFDSLIPEENQRNSPKYNTVPGKFAGLWHKMGQVILE